MNQIFTLNELQKMKITELKKICKEKKIKKYSKLRKNELINIIYENDNKHNLSIRHKYTEECENCNTCKKCVNKKQAYITDNNKIYHIKCYNKTEESVENTCSICLEEINNDDKIITECNHVFHKNCLKSWEESSYKRNCPNCRGLTQKIKTYDEILSELFFLTNYNIDNNVDKIYIQQSLEKLLLNIINLYNIHLMNNSENSNPEIVINYGMNSLLNLFTISSERLLNE